MKNHRLIIPFFRSIFLLALLSAGSLTNIASAYDVNFFQGNDILYYDPSATSACSSIGDSSTVTSNMSIPSLIGSDNAEKIWNFLTGSQGGLTPEQAAGVMGNIAQESGYDPNLTESNGIGYGIVQWSYERRTALEAAAAKQGVPVSDLGFQLAYMKQEADAPGLVDFHNLFSSFGVSASDNVWNPLKKQTSVERATTFWHDAFERSGDYTAYGSIQHRIDYANQAYQKFTGKSASSGGSTSGGNGCTVAGGAGLLQTLLAYAWPEYKGQGYIQMMPAYAAAVKKAQADGRGVGGIKYPGVDCAGFVSLLMVDSGFDPEFNSKGTYAIVPPSDTSGQVDIGTPTTGEAIERRWMQAHWKKLGTGGSINVADLKPGDVAVSYPGNPGGFFHTFLYVGQVNGFSGQYASASLDDRAPMAGANLENATNPSFEWYGKR